MDARGNSLGDLRTINLDRSSLHQPIPRYLASGHCLHRRRSHRRQEAGISYVSPRTGRGGLGFGFGSQERGHKGSGRRRDGNAIFLIHLRARCCDTLQYADAAKTSIEIIDRRMESACSRLQPRESFRILTWAFSLSLLPQNSMLMCLSLIKHS